MLKRSTESGNKRKGLRQLASALPNRVFRAYLPGLHFDGRKRGRQVFPEKIEIPLYDSALLFALKYRVRVGKGIAEGSRIRVRLLRGLP